MRDGRLGPLGAQKDNLARVHPRKGCGRIVTAKPGHRPHLFFISKVENAWWKLGAALRLSGVRSLVWIAFFVKGFLVYKIIENNKTH